MRSPDGIMTRAGTLTRRGIDPPAADRPLPPARQIVAIPADQALAAPSGRRVAPVAEPILESSTNSRADWLCGSMPRKRPNFHGEPRIERPEQGLQHIDRQLADTIGHLGQQRPADSMKAWPVLVGGSPTVPPAGQPGDATGLARRQRHAERAAHAVAHHRGRAPCRRARKASAHARAGHVGRESKRRSSPSASPIDEIGPKPVRRHGAQQALLEREIEHLPAIDQRRHDEHGASTTPPRSAVRRAVVEQTRVAFAPDGGRIFQQVRWTGCSAVAITPSASRRRRRAISR